MKTIAQPFIRLGGIEVPIDGAARRQFGQWKWKLKELKVVPFEKVGKASWNVITFLPYYDYEMRKRFFDSTKHKIHLVHFVGEDEFKRVLESYF